MTTTPQKVIVERFPLYETMRKYMAKAVQNREQYYKGVAEARDDFNNGTPGSPYATAPNAAAAEQLFQNSPLAKEFISNNQWHMKQAIMFGVGSMSSALWTIAGDVRKIRRMMEQNTKTIPHPRRPE